MEREIKVVLFYTFLGVVSGYLSQLFDKNYSLILSMVVFIYILTVYPLLKWMKSEKTIREIISTTLTTYLLVWIMIWIFFYNLYLPG